MRYFLRILSLVLVLSVSFTSLAQANDPFLLKAQNWFNSLDDAKARFAQIGSNGSELTGTFYLNRPRRLRFEYDAPITDFVVADGILIHFYDGELNDVSNAPIGQTPADFILRNDLDFLSDRDELLVTETRHNGNIFRMTLVQRDDPDSGKIILDFVKEPMRLLGWAIMDSVGNFTRIRLDELERDVKLDPRLFVFVEPDEKLGKRRQFNN
jgi:outer membrane lipoprotein-sorting protein